MKTIVVINFVWDGEKTHQLACDRAFVLDAECTCLEGTGNDTHIVPTSSNHAPTHACWCVPHPLKEDKDGDMIWLHQEIT